MKIANRLLFTVVILALGATFAMQRDAAARERLTDGADLRLSCENGRDYPIQPRAVSVDGDIVTGNLVTGPKHAVHIRLHPMGVGYRYAGRGVWFDGSRGAAILYLSKDRPLACTVVQG